MTEISIWNIRTRGEVVKEFETLLQAVEEGEKVQTITLVAAPSHHGMHVGQMMLIFPNGQVEGSLVDDEFTKKIVAKFIENEESIASIHRIPFEQNEYQVFWNMAGSDKMRAVILGGGHISQPLTQILSLLEYEVTVVDDRPVFANHERFPGAVHVVCDNFSKVLLEMEPDDRTALIIVTRGHRYDLECLRSVIGTRAGYIGMIGSRRKVGATLAVLQQEGVEKVLLDKVRAPIGLDIGGQSPAEIAVSIAAEVIATFKGGSHLPLSFLERGGE
jgi:xanthine dehydrogenase accessory factor